MCEGGGGESKIGKDVITANIICTNLFLGLSAPFTRYLSLSLEARFLLFYGCYKKRMRSSVYDQWNSKEEEEEEEGRR